MKTKQSLEMRKRQESQWKARQAGEIRPKKHTFHDKVNAKVDRRNALAELREIKEATGDIWDE